MGSCITILLATQFNASAQSASELYQLSQQCDHKTYGIYWKRDSITKQYEQELKELNSGLFCSLCNKSKTAIERSGEPFNTHINRVQGNVIHAPQAAFDQLKEEYQNSLKQFDENVENIQKECKELANRAKQKEEVEKQEYYSKHKSLEMEGLKKEQVRLKAENTKKENTPQKGENYAKGITALNNLMDAQNKSIVENKKTAFEIEEVKNDNKELSFKTNISLDEATYVTLSPDPVSSNTNEANQEHNSNIFMAQLTEQENNIVNDMAFETNAMPQALRNSYSALTSVDMYIEGVGVFVNGDMTPALAEAAFAGTPPIVIKEIQTYSGGVATRAGKETIDFFDDVMNMDKTPEERERDLERIQNRFNPGWQGTTYVKTERPLRTIDYIKAGAVAAGLGIAVTSGLPILAGIGMAAWYGFKHSQ